MSASSVISLGETLHNSKPRRRMIETGRWGAVNGLDGVGEAPWKFRGIAMSFPVNWSCTSSNPSFGVLIHELRLTSEVTRWQALFLLQLLSTSGLDGTKVSWEGELKEETGDCCSKVPSSKVRQRATLCFFGGVSTGNLKNLNWQGVLHHFSQVDSHPFTFGHQAGQLHWNCVLIEQMTRKSHNIF